MMATPFGAVPSAPFVVRRERRRRRRRQVPASSDGGRNPRRGFKFHDRKEEDFSEGLAEATPVGKKKTDTPAKDNTFVFRVRKDDEKDISKQDAVDAAAASAALRAKQEKAQRAEMRRLIRQKKREEATREALNEEDMKHKKLSADQISLYHMVQRQVKRELRKIRKEFITSAARQDIMQLSEVSLQAMKQELISFMAEHPPGNVAMKVPNPENARMRAMVETYEQRLKSLQDEKKQWLDLRATFDVDSASPSDGEDEEANNACCGAPDINIPGENKIHTDADIHEEKLSCDLEVTQSVENLQRSALQQLGTTTELLSHLDASVLSVNRLIVKAEMKRAELFTAYHDNAFKSYGNLNQPKESLRALLEMPERRGVP